MACEPDTLASDARELQSLSPRTQMEVQTYLLASLAGGSLDPNTLAEQAKDFRGMPTVALQWMKTYLLCQLTVVAAICTVAIPTNLQAEGIFGDYTFTWDYGTDPGSHFVIQVGSEPGLNDLFETNSAPNLRENSGSGMAAGTWYVRIKAVDSSTCESDYTESVQITM